MLGPGSLVFNMTLTLRGHIENGKIVVDEGVDLPEGTEVKLTLVDDTDDLDDGARAHLTQHSSWRRPRSTTVKGFRPGTSSPSSAMAIDEQPYTVLLPLVPQSPSPATTFATTRS